ncbi:hypothetical protein FD755_024191 [Muntiacus reevesi]|uniref:Prefoldin subunit 4 n=2 Tax=Muntiacus TaxID=9885 RepID=A0A5N3VAQ8_MUNRE|nr:hypothetical protein FD754_019127 [Muntiacus muntjak]KAB0346164.1 hypothetical protein FD755_024191 [Muntiacus reevesi]
MAATMKKAVADVSLTIHKLAWNTSRITELKEEIEDIMLGDDCLMIPYQTGNVFISHAQEETQEMLAEAKKNLQEETDTLESRVESIQ